MIYDLQVATNARHISPPISNNLDLNGEPPVRSSKFPPAVLRAAAAWEVLLHLGESPVVGDQWAHKIGSIAGVPMGSV